MRAILLPELRGPDALRLDEVPEPVAGEDTVLIEVAAAGVSFPDLLLTRGEYQIQPEPPFVPGVECAGRVLQAPAGSGLEEGMRVAAMTGVGGGWAERAVAPAMLTFPVPDALSDEQAAGFVMNYHTAWFALARRARLQPGEVVLVHGAGGGVGTASIQVAKGLGARVIAVASSERKADAARQAGADAVVDPGDAWLDAVKEHTTRRGVDIVVDPVGGERFADSVRALAPEGRLLVIGFAEGRIPELRMNRVLLRNADVVGVNWGGFLGHDPSILRAGRAALDELIEAGHVAPIVGEVYPLEQAAQALKDLDGRRAVGKLVLRV